MKRNFKRKKQTIKSKFGYNDKNIDPNGYLDSNRNNYSPYKVIPSNEITMEGVSTNIMAFPFTKEGKSLGRQLMKPNEEFKFDGADYVIEVPEEEIQKFQLGGNPSNPLDVGGDVTDAQSLDIQSQLNNPYLQDVTNPNISEPLTTPPRGGYPKYANNVNRASVISNMGTTEQLNSTRVSEPKAGSVLSQGLTDAADSIDRTTMNHKVRREPVIEKTYQNEEDVVDTAQNTDTGFFNPYGGFDIPTAAFTLGEGIQEGNVGQSIASGAKLITGLGRNLLSGLANKKREQFVMDEYNKKQKDGLVRTTTLQDGGTLSKEDITTINSGLDFTFTEEAAKSLFEKVHNDYNVIDSYTPNYGKYKDVGYFDVDKIDGDDIILKTTDKNPYNAQTFEGLLPYLQEQNPNKNIKLKYVPKAKEGGEIEQLLTEGFIKGADPQVHTEVNAEVESGEYIDENGEPVKEVVGKKHSEGGELLTLNPSDRVLSDHLKIGSKDAKVLKEKYDLDIKAKDTYATVLDKFKSKSGLSKILKEKEEIIKEIKKQEGVEDDSTSGLNLEFLSKKLDELNEKQEPLDTTMKTLFDETFNIQEAKKDNNGEKSSDFLNLSKAQLEELSKQSNISVEEVQKIIKNLSKGGYIDYQDGGFGNKGEGLSYVPEGQSKDDNTGLYGDVTKELLLETMTKNPWFDWKGFNPNNPQDVLRFQKQFNKLSSEGQQIKEDGRFGEQTASVRLPFTQTNGIVEGTMDIEAPLLDTKRYVPREVEENEKDDKKYTNKDVLLLPDQTPLPPDALQPHLKNQRRFDSVDPNLISPEQQIEELNRSKNQAINEINKLPDSQRRAALVKLNTNYENQVNGIISNVNRTNAQLKTQADRVNLQQSNMEENYLATDAKNFEERQLTALAKTQNDIRNYFNQLKKVQVGNYNTINNLNLMNELYDDFKFTGDGVENVSENLELTSYPAIMRMLQREGVLSGNSSTPLKREKKQNEGKIKKRRRIKRK